MTTSSEPCRVYSIDFPFTPPYLVVDGSVPDIGSWTFHSLEESRAFATKRNEDHRRRLEMQMWSV